MRNKIIISLMSILLLLFLASCSSTQQNAGAASQTGILDINIQVDSNFDAASTSIVAKDFSGEKFLESTSGASAHYSLPVPEGQYKVEYKTLKTDGSILAEGLSVTTVLAGRTAEFSLLLTDGTIAEHVKSVVAQPEDKVAEADRTKVLPTEVVTPTEKEYSGTIAYIEDLELPESSDLNIKNFMAYLDSRRDNGLKGEDYVSSFIDNLAVVNAEYSKSITQEEALSVMRNRERKDSVTYAEAIADVDLYFRLLRYRMGHYDSLGGDAVFNQARDNVFTSLEGFKNKKVSTSILSTLLAEELSFVDDCHFEIDGHQVFYEFNSDRMVHVTYLSGLSFQKDSNGYFIEEKGDKYYYMSVDNDNVRMVPMLNDRGELIYSLVMYCPPASSVSSSKVLLKGPGALTKKVSWKRSESPYQHGAFVYKESDHLAYMKLNDRCGDIEDKLYYYAQKARKKDVVIIDLRSNGGTHGYEFFKGYIDEPVSIDEVAFARVGMTNDFNMKPGEEYIYTMDVTGNGNITTSDSLTIVLVDNNTGCAPEEFTHFFSFINNSIVIGTNTKGHLDGGTTSWGGGSSEYNAVELHLPNTGMRILASTNLALYGDYESMVGKGFQPDIFVDDTSRSLDYVIKLLVNEGYITSEDAKICLPRENSKVDSEVYQNLPWYNEDKAIEMVECDSKYGKYYEARKTITPEDNVMSFTWSKPDTSNTYWVEVMSGGPDDQWVDTGYLQVGVISGGADLGGGNVPINTPVRLQNKPFYGTIYKLDESFEPFEVVFRLFPIEKHPSDLKWMRWDVPVGDTRPALIIAEEGKVIRVNEYGVYEGSYEDWPNKPY